MASGKRHPQPGDLIEINRGIYQHWALYLGDGYVIHVTAEDEGIPRLSAGSVAILTKKAKVKKQLLKEVVGTDDWKVNNKYDKSHTPLPVEEIIQHAELYIDMEVPYELLSKNCEHFVTMLRYGKEVSSQARRAIQRWTSLSRKVVAGAVVGGVTAAAVIVGAAPVVSAAVVADAALTGVAAATGVAAGAGGVVLANRTLKAAFSFILGNKRKSN